MAAVDPRLLLNELNTAVIDAQPVALTPFVLRWLLQHDLGLSTEALGGLDESNLLPAVVRSLAATGNQMTSEPLDHFIELLSSGEFSALSPSQSQAQLAVEESRGVEANGADHPAVSDLVD
eukprot:NODE_11415_length_550_cov_116.585480_g11131_i0.p1 GENE.NODE_11415_length_550_cov_116.585480_g11131_i0~~NODE_11415_length_550_cov_116.585480_g11131_i0.p1  ORF type:complete len:121 (+),score=17.06 NODE_11415_length_550_cov_116.585480_g11131_i0:75-437(+)